MRKTLALTIGLIALTGMATAANVSITDVTVKPDREVWMSQDFNISGHCKPTAETRLYVDNLTVIDETGDAIKPELDTDDLRFNNIGGYLPQSSLQPYINEFGPGYFFFDLQCEETDGQATDAHADNFTVKELDLALEDTTTGSYAGEPYRIQAQLTNTLGGGAVTDNVDFEVLIDGDPVSLTKPTPYAQGDTWMLNITLPNQPDTYDLTVRAHHDGATATASRQLTVERALQFQLSVTPSSVTAGDRIEIGLDGQYRGDNLPISRDDIQVRLDGNSLSDVEAQTGESCDNCRFSITAPEKEPGAYDLDVKLTAGNTAATRSSTVTYPAQLNGDISNHDGTPLPFDLALEKGGKTVKRMSGKGSYSLGVIPDVYDVVFSFPDPTWRAQLTLTGIPVAGWDSPLRYARYADTSIPGLRLGGLYAFKSSLNYNTALIEMSYTTENIRNPDDLSIYYCSGWNFENKQCYSEWSAIGGTFDSVSSTAQTNASFLDGAYAVGKREKLRLDYSLPSDRYTPDDTVQFSGRVQDGSKQPVPNATVDIEVIGSSVSRTVRTAGDGTFSVSFPAPNQDLEYRIAMEAAKQPYRSDTEDISFNVDRVADMELALPDSVPVTANTTTTVDAYLRNTGFQEIRNLQPYTSDVPFFSRLSLDRRPLQVNESRKVSLLLDIPADTDPQTYTADIAFGYDDRNVSKTFGIVVEPSVEAQERQESDTASTSTGITSSLTGRLSAMPSIDLGSPTLLVVIALLVQALVVVAAVRTRSTEERRKEISRAFNGIKDTIKEEKQHFGSHTGEHGGRFSRRDDSIERDRVMRSISRIKQELQEHRQTVE
jgi:hypothetical protein